MATHVALARAGRAAKGDVGVGLRVEHLDGRMEVEIRCPLAEAPAIGAIYDGDLAVLEPGQLAEKQPATETLQPGIPSGAGVRELRRDDRGFHGTLRRNGQEIQKGSDLAARVSSPGG